jgi:hypothetical protein
MEQGWYVFDENYQCENEEGLTHCFSKKKSYPLKDILHTTQCFPVGGISLFAKQPHSMNGRSTLSLVGEPLM